ncbi:MAG: hypothetical protein AAFQ99_10940 [Pseudomonadota bacterium]
MAARCWWDQGALRLVVAEVFACVLEAGPAVAEDLRMCNLEQAPPVAEVALPLRAEKALRRAAGSSISPRPTPELRVQAEVSFSVRVAPAQATPDV